VKADTTAAAAMKQQYEKYRQLYPALKPLFGKPAE